MDKTDENLTNHESQFGRRAKYYFVTCVFVTLRRFMKCIKSRSIIFTIK